MASLKTLDVATRMSNTTASAMAEGFQVIIKYRGPKHDRIVSPATSSSEFANLDVDRRLNVSTPGSQRSWLTRSASSSGSECTNGGYPYADCGHAPRPTRRHLCHGTSCNERAGVRKDMAPTTRFSGSVTVKPVTSTTCLRWCDDLSPHRLSVRLIGSSCRNDLSSR